MAAKDDILGCSISNDHYSALGRVAASWAALESVVSSAIWQIGEIPDEIGACITSQIFTFDAKMKALISILEVRGGLHKTISDLNKFHEEVRSVAAFRHRAVHDPWIHDLKTNTPHRLQITADKKPILEYRPTTTEELLENVERTVDLIEKFQKIVTPAMDRFPPLPSTA